jgi:hypothetical protein
LAKLLIWLQFRGDLASGSAYFSIAGLGAEVNQVFLVNLVNKDGEVFNGFNSFSRSCRIVPRLFRVPDGTAGVLLEATGDFYRLTELKPYRHQDKDGEKSVCGREPFLTEAKK